MSTDGQDTKWRRNIAKSFNWLSIRCTSVTDRQTTDERGTALSNVNVEFTFAKNRLTHRVTPW